VYYIEVDFDNGKTLKKVTPNLNESYAVYCRYSCVKRKKVKVIAIRAGVVKG